MIEYKSQYRQDRFVDLDVFAGMENGFFVDIGANDGITFSNTWTLETARGWTGICIEPMPRIFAELSTHRKCICVKGCVASTPGLREFTQVTGPAHMLSGLSDKIDKAHVARIERESRHGGGPIEKITVACWTFNALMEEHKVRHIDYCSIDTEGCELEILKSIDFARFGANCYTVEDNDGVEQLSLFMESKGYRMVEKLGDDVVFVSREHLKKIKPIGLLRTGERSRRFLRRAVRRILPDSMVDMIRKHSK